MRSIYRIKRELEEAERTWMQTRSRLHNEIADIQEKCPHPDAFLEVNHKDYEDCAGGPATYDHSMTKAVCHLCEKVAYSEAYDKGANGEAWKEYRPSARDILK